MTLDELERRGGRVPSSERRYLDRHHTTLELRMRRSARTALAITTVALAGSVAVPAAHAQEPSAPECASLGVVPDPACLVADEVEALLEPSAPAPAPAPVPAAPAPAPAGESGGASSSDAQATSASPSTAASVSGGSAGPAGSSASSTPAPASHSRVPAVPEGSALELSPLALPSFGLTGQPAVTADQLAISDAVTKELVVPAARAAAELPDRSRTTAVVMAIGMLLLAGGLLLDQVRKARLPFPL